MPLAAPYILTDFRRSIEAHVPQKALRDLWYRVRFGGAMAKSDSAIFVPAATVNFALEKQPEPQRFRRQNSGALVPGDWDLARVDIEGNTKLKSCRMRWEQGADWEETPIYQRLTREIQGGATPDGCGSMKDLRARYAALDALFEATKRSGRLLTRAELPDGFRREHGGILLHVARDGTCLRSGGGAHRFAIAKILNLQNMPAQLGAVHPEAMQAGYLKELTVPKDREPGAFISA